MRLSLLLLLAACTGSPKDTGDTSLLDTAATDTSVADTADTATQGTDADHDGWTVAQGDCNDHNPLVNPGMTETQDGIDDDCDGMIDEQFADVMVVQIDTSAAITSRVLGVDVLGNVADTFDLAGTDAAATGAQWMANDPAGGWWLVDGQALAVYHLSESGTATTAWTAAGDTGLTPTPTVLYGAAATTDGLFTSTGDRLLQITGGTATAVASWNTTDLTVTAIAADPRGHFTLLGQAGGVATWSAGAGYSLVVADPQHPTATFTDATADEQGRVFALGNAVVGGQFTTGVFRWDAPTTSFVLFVPWVDSNGDPITFQPVSLAMDDERDEFYVTANGGWFRTIWRLLPDAGYGSVLWPDPATLQQTPPAEDEFRFFTGAAIHWSHH